MSSSLLNLDQYGFFSFGSLYPLKILRRRDLSKVASFSFCTHGKLFYSKTIDNQKLLIYQAVVRSTYQTATYQSADVEKLATFDRSVR